MQVIPDHDPGRASTSPRPGRRLRAVGTIFALVGVALLIIDPGAGILVGAYMALVGVWLLTIKVRAGIVVGSIGLLMFGVGRILGGG